MKKQLIAFVFALLPGLTFAAGSSVPLDRIELDPTNKESLQNGMRLFVDNCMGCHSAKFQRYERAATDLGIDPAVVEQELIHSDQKIGEQMTIAMSTEDATKWFGAPPPDLSLETRLRGPDWVYTYLRSFYQDESTRFGVNNKVLENASMPNVLGYLQGVQVCQGEHCEELALVPGTGTQSQEEFDQTVYDLVNFMAYMADPIKVERHKLGTYVLIFLAIFFVFAYALKKEYWKDVH